MSVQQTVFQRSRGGACRSFYYSDSDKVTSLAPAAYRTYSLHIFIEEAIKFGLNLHIVESNFPKMTAEIFKSAHGYVSGL